jgi:hypothetical protein
MFRELHLIYFAMSHASVMTYNTVYISYIVIYI